VRKKFGALVGPGLPDAPPVKKNPIARVGVAAVVVLALAAGGLFLASRGSTSPNEKATAVTAQVANDVVIVIAGNDSDGSVNARIKATIDQFNADSGCKFIGGTVTFGNTFDNANAVANKYILRARQTPGGAALGENLGIGYTVVSTQGLIRGEKFAAVIAAVDCSPPATNAPGFGS